MDAAVRTWAPPLLQVITQRDAPTLRAWLTALFDKGGHSAVDAPTRDLERLHAEVALWMEQLLAGAEEPFRICLRLEPPAPPEPAREEEMRVWVPEACQRLYEERDQIRGMRYTYAPPLLRHFTARFEPL